MVPPIAETKYIPGGNNRRSRPFYPYRATGVVTIRGRDGLIQRYDVIVIESGLCGASLMGMCCFGTDPAISVPNIDCRAHGLDNHYVTDSSFFTLIGAVNPMLTIIANPLRVADLITDRL